jgi:hypothetical protein
MIPLIDVHTFDGSLKNRFKPQFTSRLSKEEAIERINQVLSSIKDPTAKKCTELILQDTKGNEDHTNQLNALDLLFEVFILVSLTHREKDLMQLLEEQLKDCYLLGQCPQGRTTRLFQIWLSILDHPQIRGLIKN